MAYVVPLLSEEEQKKNEQVNGSSVVGSTSQSSVIPGSGGGGQAAQGQQAPKRSATGFTNFSTYLTANQGQGQRMANDRADDIQAEAKQTMGQVDKETNQFLQGQGVYDQSGKLNTSKFDTKSIPQDFSKTDFTRVGQQDFNKLYNQSSNEFGQFKPTSERPGYNFLKDPNAAKNQAESFSGRTAELQQEYGKGNAYGRGLQNLDAFLLGQSDLGQKRASGIQSTIDYAKAGQGSGLGQINKAIGDFGQSAKNYDAAIAQSRDAYQKQYQNQLGQLGSQYSALENQIKGLKPSVNLYGVDEQGNIIANGLAGQKADKIYTAPNGQRYTVQADQSEFEKLYNPLQETFGNYSKVAGLTNQKVNPLADYKTAYQSALDKATSDLIAQYEAKNRPVSTAGQERAPQTAVMGQKSSSKIPNPITATKGGKITFNKDALVPLGAKESLGVTKKVAEAGMGAMGTVTKADKAKNPVRKISDKVLDTAVGGLGFKINKAGKSDAQVAKELGMSTEQYRNILASGKTNQSAYGYGGELGNVNESVSNSLSGLDMKALQDIIKNPQKYAKQKAKPVSKKG